MNVKFREEGDDLVAAVNLPPEVKKQDVRVHVSPTQLELLLKGARLIEFDLLTTGDETRARATVRNHVLDVVMPKAELAS